MLTYDEDYGIENISVNLHRFGAHHDLRLLAYLRLGNIITYLLIYLPTI